MQNSFYIAELIVKQIKGTINSKEQKELEVWRNESTENASLFERATNTKEQLSKLEIYNLFNAQKVWDRIDNELFEPKTIWMFSRRTMTIAAAILIPLLMVSSAAFFYFTAHSTVFIATLDAVYEPGTQKATLVLSNGNKVALDSEDSPETITEHGSQIQNRNQSLVYSADNESEIEAGLVFNELITPRGGGYALELADGTNVWMNAGSKLKFPVAFTDTIRQVFLEGEAYFDVSHNGKPFVVSSAQTNVRVLGTEFNISAYSNDEEIKTTLVEGAVRIEITDKNTQKINSKNLSPNNQAIISNGKNEISIIPVNTSQYTSWLKGKLEFENETLEQVMKRLSRWYDFEYEFTDNEVKEYHFTARIDKSLSISKVLEMLEMTTSVKFDYKDDKIIVLKKIT